MPTPEARQGPLQECVSKAVGQYLRDMGDHDPDNLYRFVLCQVEKPLICEVLEWTNGNQCRAASILGISRGTLRKKIKDLGLQ